MLRQYLGSCLARPPTSKPLTCPFFNRTSPLAATKKLSFTLKEASASGLHNKLLRRIHASRRVRYNVEEDEDEEYNPEIALLESYSESVRNEALLVRAMVDNKDEEILIFKGFSSCLSYTTSPDPSRSILPARAVITSIDRVIGPFDPANIQYIEKGLSWDAFKTRFQPNQP